MRTTTVKRLSKHCLWLSLLLHFLFLLSFLFTFQLRNKIENRDTPNLHIPAYLQQETVPVAAPLPEEQKKIETDADGIEKALKKANSQELMSTQSAQTRQLLEPLHLVGNKNIRKPLLELLGRALTRTIFYPRIAMDFNLHGTAYIGFNLQPNGIVDEVRLMQSSGTEVLDQAALKGVEAISPVAGVRKFLNQKRFLVVGIIFR